MSTYPAVTEQTADHLAALVRKLASYGPNHDIECCLDFIREQLERMDRFTASERSKPQRDASRRARVAYHEAGHVVAAFAVGYTECGRVEIQDDGSGVAHIAGGLAPLAGKRHAVARMVVVDFAGDAAEVVQFGSGGRGNEGDIDDARATIAGFHRGFGRFRNLGSDGNERRVTRYEQRLSRVASHILRAHWSAVEALAAALLTHGSLEGGAVKRVLRPYFGQRRRPVHQLREVGVQ
jgi:hypothetical protein